MTFQTPVYAVDGNSEPGNFLRLMLQGTTLGSQGTVGHLDCQVNATGPATSGIIIGAGSVVVLGQEVANQGSYYGYNLGNDTTLTIAATGGSARSDMVVVRAEDPTWSGSSWGNPASGQILFPRVISNVGSGATTVPGGYSAIPLARIDMPASTSVVQQSYIHDLRSVCNPQRQIQAYAAAGPGSQQNATTGTVQIQWPPGATWAVQIPSFATLAVLFFQVNEALFLNVGNGTARGFIWVAIGPTVSSPVLITPLTLYSTQDPGRHTIAGAAQVAIPPSIRGTTQNFSFAQYADGTNTGNLAASEGTSSFLLVEFVQQAALV